MIVVPKSPVMSRISYRFVKRAMDILLSSAALVILSPMFLLISVIIKLTSRGPILHRYEMVGCGGQLFWGQKFRSMSANAHAIRFELEDMNEMKGPVFKIKNDPRVTKIGRLLRKYSLDEFPQLWNVLKGDMSLVGPRPPGPYEVDGFEDWHLEKLAVKPGATSTWIINGKPTDFDEWAKLDIEYINNWSLWLDIVIIAKTIPVVLFGQNQ
tara:strand:- start:200 stop:832 length:633 start_codon:yes stop_codon:yes gene_type:complete